MSAPSNFISNDHEDDGELQAVRERGVLPSTTTTTTQMPDAMSQVLRTLHTPSDGSLIVKQSTIPDAGLGVFALRGFDKGDAITKYHGHVISFSDARSLRASGKHTHCRALFPMRMVIDGLRLTSDQWIDYNQLVKTDYAHGVAAFINDSRNKATNNVEFDFADSAERVDNMFLFDPRYRVVFVRATRDITAGEELFLDYGEGYWQPTR